MNDTIYGFSHDPFSADTETTHMFSHEEHRRARSCLEYEVMHGTAVVIIAGQAGVGKHALITDFLRRYPLNDLEEVQFSSRDCGSETLMVHTASAFGISPPPKDEDSATNALEAYLAEKQAAGKKTLLVIYHAHQLAFESLEKLRLFIVGNGNPPLLCLYLVGDPSIQKLLNDFTDKYPLGGAVSHISLGPISSAQGTRNYVEHRLKNAGWDEEPCISSDALSLLHRHSGGLPRRINQICSRLLAIGAAAGKHTLEDSDVESAVAQLAGDTSEAAIVSPTTEADDDTEVAVLGAAAAPVAETPAAPDYGQSFTAVDRPTQEPAAASGTQPPRRRSPWGAVLALLCLAALALGVAVYWDLNNTRRLIGLDDIADVLRPLTMSASTPAKTSDSAAPANDVKEPARGAIAEDDIEHSEPAAEDITVTEDAPQPRLTDTENSEEQVTGDAAIDTTPAPIEDERTDLTAPLEQAAGPDSAAAAADTAVPDVPATGLTPAPFTTPEPAIDSIELLLPTSRRVPDYLDVGLVETNGGLVINPALAEALRPYADKLVWRSDGTLEIIPYGINLQTGEYDLLELQHSADGIAFVVRNFRSVGLLINAPVNDINGREASQQPLAGPRPAFPLVRTRLLGSGFAPRQVLPLDETLTYPSHASDRPIQILVVPHRGAGQPGDMQKQSPH